MLFPCGYLAQCAAIRELAAQGPCVIVGRGACEQLEGRVPLLSVFLYADLQARAKRAIGEYGDAPEQIEKRITEIDRKRMAYYHFYGAPKSQWSGHFNLCIDTGRFDCESATRLILEAYRNLIS